MPQSRAYWAACGAPRAVRAARQRERVAPDHGNFARAALDEIFMAGIRWEAMPESASAQVVRQMGRHWAHQVP